MMTKTEIRAIAHNQAKHYMRTMERPTKWGLMTDADKNLFLFVRGVNTETLTVINKK